MANRMLTTLEILQHFMEYTADTIEVRQPNNHLPDIEVYHRATDSVEKFGVQDLVLGDLDFINNRVKVLLKQWGASPPKPVEIEVTTDALLSERGSTHGDYSNLARVIQSIKRVMVSSDNHSNLTDTQKESLDLIATKIGRIVTGDPNCIDHWDDIIGYATLARDRIARKPKG